MHVWVSNHKEIIMATVNKDFKVKHGLIVEGENATVDGSDIITADSITAGNGEGGNENVTVSYDAETKKVTFAAAPGYSDEDVKDVLTGSTQTNISITEVEGVLTITAENGVEDSDTDDLDEGETNFYFTDQRALDATAEAYDLVGAAAQALSDAEDYADGLATNYDVAGAAAQALSDAEDYADGLAVNYDVAGAAAQALSDAEDYADGLATNYEASGAVSTHSDLTTGVHGVAGDVVGTTDTQDISNKRIVDTLYFTDGVTVADEGQIAVKPTTHEFEIKANYGDLDLKTAAEGADVNITSDYGDIILNADGNSYLTSADAGNEIVTKSYVDGLIQGLDVKESVVTASTANFDITTNASGGIGGSALANGDRVLLKNQTNIAENGIYVYNSSTQTIVASTDPADTDLNQGAYVLVEKGTNAATGWIVTNTSGGGDTWSQFSAANEYTAGTGITIDANAISVTADTYDAYGAAAQALSDAEDYADGLETDDIEEGVTNLYFTDTRAVDALEAIVPNFTAIEVNSVAKQVAAIVSAPTAVQTVAYAFAKATYRSAKFLVKVARSTHTEVSEVLLTLDTSDNIAITEFAVVSTNGSASAISAGINGSNVELLVTPTNASSTITVFGTLLSEDLFES